MIHANHPAPLGDELTVDAPYLVIVLAPWPVPLAGTALLLEGERSLAKA